MPSILIELTEEEHERLKKLKGDVTWREVLLHAFDGAGTNTSASTGLSEDQREEVAGMIKDALRKAKGGW